MYVYKSRFSLHVCIDVLLIVAQVQEKVVFSIFLIDLCYHTSLGDHQVIMGIYEHWSLFRSVQFTVDIVTQVSNCGREVGHCIHRELWKC